MKKLSYIMIYALLLSGCGSALDSSNVGENVATSQQEENTPNIQIAECPTICGNEIDGYFEISEEEFAYVQDQALDQGVVCYSDSQKIICEQEDGAQLSNDQLLFLDDIFSKNTSTIGSGTPAFYTPITRGTALVN